MTKNTLIVGLGSLIIGLLLGYLIFYRNTATEIRSVREVSSNYKFINPLLFIHVPEDSALPEYRPLKNTLENYVSKTIENSDGDIKNISIYFRNLNSSQWVGVNYDEIFSPASMLKVVTLIATLREAENNPTILKSTAYIKASDKTQNDTQTYFLPQNPVVPGKSYTIDELLQRMIIDSDNIANSALQEIIGEEKINKTYADLELPLPDEAGVKGYTTRQYSHLFRAIYNGTYLSKSLSEKILELLSKTNFDRGIVAGLPEGIIVAHKFGIRSTETNDTLKTKSTINELHDCGIVYNETDPYFLCVMTRGKDFTKLENAIKDISKITWEKFKSLKN